MFRKALEWGYLGENPAQTVKLLRVPKGSFRFLSREEADKLLDACRESTCRQLFLCVAVALHTGMRLGEIFHLRWSDVGLKEKKIQVVSREGAHTKNYDSRTIPISEFLLDVLNAHPRRLDTPYVFFQQNGSPLTNIRPQFEIAIRRAEIEHVRFHDLRHTFASWLVMGGVDIRTVQELLGHKKIDMTMRYAHLAPDHMRNAIRVLDGHPMDTESNFSVDEAESECKKVS